MTQSIINNINNIETMLSTNPQAPNQSKLAGIDDRLENFNTKLDKAFSTINNVKTAVSVNNSKNKLTQFRELQKKSSNESNVETAPDLTLARDIGEIIAQLKDFATSIVEDTKESDTDSITDDILDIPTEDSLSSELIDGVYIAQEEEHRETEESENFEQLLGYTGKVVEPKSMNMTTVNELKEPVNVQESIDTTVTETVDILEDTAAKPNEERQSDTLESLVDEDILKDLRIESVKAETNSAESEDFMQHQTPEENALKAIINSQVNENFDNKLESVQSSQNPSGTPNQATEMNPSRILSQITKHLEGLQNGSKVNIVLNPESLGKVEIQILTTKEGLSAQFTVTTQEARDLIMKGLDGLKESLLSHGVGCDNVSVKIADSQKSEYEQDWTEQENSENGNKEQQQQNRQEKEKGLFEKMMKQTRES